MELHRIAFIKILDLIARGQTPAVKENIFAAIIGSNEAKAFLPHDFFYGSCHDDLLAICSRRFLDIYAALTYVELPIDITKTRVSAILFYITGHGFGHAVRSHQVIRAVRNAAPQLPIYVRSTAPEWLFHDGSQEAVVHSRGAIDVGIVQRDSLAMDLGETLRSCRAMHARAQSIIERELDFLRQHDIGLLVSDIPPLAFEIAARASIPSIAISNFSWNWIYRAYLKNYPAFSPLIEEMETFYRKATLALMLPYPGDMSVFARTQSIPWITRTSTLNKKQARAQFNLPQSATIALLSFGGLGLERLPWQTLRQLQNYYFVATGKTPQRQDNVTILPEAQPSYFDLVRAADIVIAKPGYGIVADVIAHQIPVLYTERGDFPEYLNLVRALNDLATAEFISQQDLLSGHIEPQLDCLLSKKPHWPTVALEGAAFAAEIVLALQRCSG